ncbi:MAG: hypothetical protein R2761_11295 [Acidimicrobiales bacterium]
MGDAAASALRTRVLLGLAVLLAAGCSAPGGGSGDAAYQLPTFLPDGFETAAPSGCVAGDPVAPHGFLSVFGDDGRRRFGPRQTPAEIRFGLWDSGQASVDGAAPLTADDILDAAVPASVYDTDVNGHRATGFAVHSVDPTDTGTWPAVVWTDGDLLLWLYGDGITLLEVVEVAESVEHASQEDFERMVPVDACSSSLALAPTSP